MRDADDTISPGERLGGFRIEGEIGRGGIGVVYRAVRETDGAEVALKLLLARFAADPTYRHRFQHEARAAREVSHPALVPVVDAGEIDGRLYIASRFVDGQSLDALIKAHGALAEEAVVRIALELGSGIDELHRRGIVHRDIKPSNVLVDARGAASLGDFGLAKGPAYTALTRAGEMVGTVGYLAPELIRGEPPTAATDLYAFGCLIYEALAGVPPFAGMSPFQVVAAHLGDEPRDPRAARPGLRAELAAAAMPALVKEAAARPPSAEAYARMLAGALSGERSPD